MNEDNEIEIDNEVGMDSAVAAKVKRYVFVESGRRGGSKTGPTKARKGTGTNVSRYWDRVYAGEIKHPGYDPKAPCRKSRSKRYSDGVPISAKVKKSRTDTPRRAAPVAVVPPEVNEDFDSVMASMGLGF